MTNIHDFIQCLNDLVDERFPHTTRWIVHGGDFIKDVVVELREENKKLRYSPYDLFNKSYNYEETIEQLLTQWECMLH